MQDRIQVIVGDIVKQHVDAIVTAANSELAGGGGVDYAVHKAAGPELVKASMALAPCPAGEARTTKGFRLQAAWVIHAVGPMWNGGNSNEAELLASVYRNALQEAVRVGARTVAFPAISTGLYGYPCDEAAIIAVKTVVEFLQEDEILQKIILACYSERAAEAHRTALTALNMR